MPELSIVISVYNRRDSLYLVLCALDKARAHYGERFEVIVTDDGSTDDPLGAMHAFKEKFALRYIWQPHYDFRAGEAYNRGCAIARGRNILLTDADILLAPESLAHLCNIAKANPSVIVAGRYDWLTPMSIRPRDVYYNWDKLIAEHLQPLEIVGEPKGIVGIDPRYRTNPHMFDGELPQAQFAAVLFAGVLMFPKELYVRLGGFDEQMIGHGGQDCELSIRAQQANCYTIFSGRVHGYHMYHDRDQVANQKACNKNVRYIARKHDLASAGLYFWHRKNAMGIARIGEPQPE